MVIRQGEKSLLRQERQAEFVIGSGHHGHTFVSVEGGCFFQMPLTWYSDESRWDLSPGYQWNQNPGFSRRITDGCIACHSGRVNRELDAPNRFHEPFFAEQSIGCERCHGPGVSHQDFHGTTEHERSITDPMIDLVRLTPARQDSICLQCHLAGRSRVLRNGHEDFDFRPGDLISDHWVVFVSDGGADDLRAVGHAEQLAASVCYQKSEGRMVCISCHDPHSNPGPSERVEFYRAKCQVCHQDGANACREPMPQRILVENSCVDCHMSSVAASNIPHTARTSHLIGRNPPRPVETASRTVPGRIQPFEVERFPLSAADIARANGISLSRQAMVTRSPGDAAVAIDELAALMSSEDLMVLQYVAESLILLGHEQSARKLVLQCVEFNPGNETFLELAIRLNDGREPEQMLEIIERYFVLNPGNAQAWQTRAQILADRGKLDDAIVAAQRAVACDPLNPACYRLLEAIFTAAGNKEESARVRETLQIFEQQRP